MQRRYIILVVFALTFLGCALFSADPTPETVSEEPAETEEIVLPTPTPTELLIAPTLTPVGADPVDGEDDSDSGSLDPLTLTPSPTPEAGEEPVEATGEPTTEATPEATPADDDTEAEEDTEGAAPTAIPEPTQIPADAENNTTFGTGGPEMRIDPQLGEPGQTVLVEGAGFEAEQTVTLHWGPFGGPTGPEVEAVETDDDGEFSVLLDVPAANQWPGDGAQEGEQIEIRAVYDEFGSFAFVAFKYVEIFNPQVPILGFDNPDEGYSITMPNGWAWSWTDDNTDDVRFTGPGGAGRGFIRTYDTSDTSFVINTVMSIEFPGVGYTTDAAGAGIYPGTQAVTDNGDVVYFYTLANGKTYALYFVDDSGNTPLDVIGTFTLLET